MKDKLEQRLQDLRSEFESGEKMLAELESKRSDLQATLLRISGAMQVLQELLGQETEPEDVPAEQFKEQNADGAEPSRHGAEGLVASE